MPAPGAAGERFLVVSGELAVAMKQIGATLRSHSRPAAAEGIVVRVAALFSAEFQPIAADLGFVKQVSNQEARRVLALQPQTSKEAIIACAASLIVKNLV